MEDVPIVKAATAYDASNGEVYILVMNQALYLGEHMEHSLLCPNQARSNGIIVNDVPKHLALTITDTTHSIVFPEDDVTLPLELQGVISKITIRLPNIEEIENCRWLTLTSAQNGIPMTQHSWKKNAIYKCIKISLYQIAISLPSPR